MRLIDADYLKEQIEYNQEYVNPKLDICNILRIIDDTPTINFAVPINIKEITTEEKETLIKGFTRNGFTTFELYDEKPQGEWITRHEQNIFGDDVVCFECNKCGEYKVPLYHLLITEPLKVCPNCGADMRGKEE